MCTFLFTLKIDIIVKKQKSNNLFLHQHHPHQCYLHDFITRESLHFIHNFIVDVTENPKEFMVLYAGGGCIDGCNVDKFLQEGYHFDTTSYS